MNTQQVRHNLEALRDARAAWLKANRSFNSDVAYIMRRLLFEALSNRMSAEAVAKASGYTLKQVRSLMRANGMNPKSGKTLLTKQASEALMENAALLGVEPADMDLMSPLAYLPMGQAWRERLSGERLSEAEVDALVGEHVERVNDLVNAVMSKGLSREAATNMVNAAVEAGVTA